MCVICIFPYPTRSLAKQEEEFLDYLIDEGLIPLYVKQRGQFIFPDLSDTDLSRVIRIKGDNVRLRSQPNTEARIMKAANTGDYFDYIGEWINPQGEKWFALVHEGAEGEIYEVAWVYGQFAEHLMAQQWAQVTGGEDFFELCLSGTAQEIEAAIKNGADVNASNQYGDTALMVAVLNNVNPEVIVILLKNGADINAEDMYGNTALSSAAGSGYTEILSILLRNGADVNARDGISGWTALMCAVNNTEPESISILLRNGVDASIRDNYGERAIDIASKNSNLRNTAAYQQLLAASNVGSTGSSTVANSPTQEGSASTHTASPLDTHKEGFGPRIKGIQLGMNMTLRNLVETWVELTPDINEARLTIWFGEKRFGLEFTKDGEQLKVINIAVDELPEERFSNLRTLDELFKRANERGFSRASLSVDTLRIEINDRNRVSRFVMEKDIFDAQSMSLSEFTQALSKAYNFPDLISFQESETISSTQTAQWEDGSREVSTTTRTNNGYRGKNLNEGWEVTVQHRSINIGRSISGGTSVWRGTAMNESTPLSVKGEVILRPLAAIPSFN